ncbi:MAG: metallophosphoesterase [Xenococcaceae cyanobacterium MO_207.B15]|nr:metallophosphoesterase [Xenococcaceae cyanobacterium MO_207.B15]
MYILHLSDLHFGDTKDANRWHGQLSNDLGQLLNQLEPSQPPRLDALIISGDIANKSLPEEYNAAALFIDRIMQDFSLKHKQVAIAPGNHDLNWELSEDAFTPVRRKDYQGSLNDEDIFEDDLIIDGNFVLVPNPTQYEQRFKYFSDFYENIIWKPYPQRYSQQYELQYFPEQQDLLILSLNSAWKLNHDPKYRTCASINPDALINAIRQINENPTYKNSRLKIAVWHHPLNSPFEDRIKDHGFLEQLAQNGFRLALHGHIHRSGREDFRHRAGSKVDIIAAGTFGAPVKEWVPGYPLQYNLLKWKDNKMTVYTRKRIELNRPWQPDAMWVQADGITASSFYEIELWTANQVNGERHKPPDFPKPSNSNTAIKKILILEANPQRNIDLNEEIRDLKNVIQQSRDRKNFQIEVGLAVRSKDLHDLILNFEPNIVHFCGHGAGEPGLVFLDKKIATDALSNLFELFKEHLECVVLNACYSEVQASAIVKHINYVVGMKQAIRDDAAIAFSLGFYRALGYGRSIEDAYKFGCNAIQLAIEDRSTKRDVIAEEMRKLVVVEPMPLKNIPEHLKPVLYKRE